MERIPGNQAQALLADALGMVRQAEEGLGVLEGLEVAQGEGCCYIAEAYRIKGERLHIYTGEGKTRPIPL